MFPLILWIKCIFLNIFIRHVTPETVTLLEPTTITVKEHGNAKFSCYSSNSSLNVVRYWWQINNVSIVNMILNLENCSNYHYNQSLLSMDSYTADCDNQGHASLLLKHISRTLKWLTCIIVTNEHLYWSKESYMHALYPPKIRTMSNVSLIEYSVFNISCDVNVGYPRQTTFKWTRDTGDFSSNGEQFLLKNVTRRDAAMYTCTVNNTMTPTYGETSYGRDSKSFYLDVLYPPTVQEISNIIAIENQTVEVKCPVVKSNPPTIYVRWLKDGHVLFTNDILYINNISRNQMGDYTCLANNTMLPTVGEVVYGRGNGTFNLKVAYPPRVSPLRNVSVIEMSELSKTCETTAGYPSKSTFIWTRDIDNFVSYGKSLVFQGLSRNISTWYTCTANNTMIPTNGTLEYGRGSGSFYLDILYPPRVSSLIDITVIEHNPVIVECLVTPGNPKQARIQWKHGIDFTVNETLYIPNVKRNQTGTYSCTANNTMTPTDGESVYGRANSSFLLTIAYPPRVELMKNVSVVFESNFNKTCDVVAGYPSKTTIKWTRDIDGFVTLENNLLLENVSKRDSSKYTCTANNTMIPTNGSTEYGTGSGTFFLDVLFPTVFKHPLRNTSVVEGGNFTVTCEASVGNPQETFYNWTRNGVLISNTSVLEIPKVKRGDDSIYSCTLFNIMTPTDGNTMIVHKTSDFHLNVFFKANVTKLTANNETEKLVITNGQSLTIRCAVEGNPVAETLLYRTIQSDNDTFTNGLTHNVTNATHINAGIYVCTGQNNYTTENVSRREVTVIVKGPPMPYGNISNPEKIYKKLNERATMSFKTYPYLDENGTLFSWFKGVDILNNSNINVTSRGDQTNLTLFNIAETDFGNYSLWVNNSVGRYVQNYEIIAKDIPDMPKNLSVVEETITSTSVTIRWIPGFDGGSNQSFIVQYQTQELSTTDTWLKKEIHDSGEMLMNTTLDDLWSKTTYLVKVLSTNAQGKSNTTQSVTFYTKDAKPQPVVGTNTAAIIGGTVSGIVVIVATLVILWIIRKRHKKKPTKQVYQNIPFGAIARKNTKPPEKKLESKATKETPNDELQDLDDAPQNIPERTEYFNEAVDSLKRIQVRELFAYVLGRAEEAFDTDYQKIPTDFLKPCTFARKPENMPLNRYRGIFPYDHSRVKIASDPEFFMNGCYIDGYQKRNEYIASLGPTIKTTDTFINFWKMLWFHQSDVIVMLTNLNEPSGPKCDQYWPENKTNKSYGDFHVSGENQEVFAEYTVRHLVLTFNGQRRRVTHLHYTAWPDKKVPEDAATLLEFRQRLKTTHTLGKGPIIVHCSAGIGRTGTLIALDRLIAEGKNEGSVDVFTCVNSMREQRVKMVQTLEQYIYIYKALVCRLYFKCQTIALGQFHSYVQTLNNNTISEQFQNLKQSVETDSKEEITARRSNEKLVTMNRQDADIPGNRYRVRLFQHKDDQDADYINAVYLNSFRKVEHFITAQSPLSNGVYDFISMIHQENCSCIVTMEDMQEPGRDVGAYLPSDGQTLKVRKFTVSCKTLDANPDYIVREMRIQNNSKIGTSEHVAYHFHFTAWMPGNDTPRDVKQFVQFVKAVDEYDVELCEEESHVLVHCLKASERSALFCLVSILLEKIQYEGHVNVLNTVRHMRTRRRETLTSMEQLKFCYQALDHSIGTSAMK